MLSMKLCLNSILAKVTSSLSTFRIPSLSVNWQLSVHLYMIDTAFSSSCGLRVKMHCVNGGQSNSFKIGVPSGVNTSSKSANNAHCSSINSFAALQQNSISRACTIRKKDIHPILHVLVYNTNLMVCGM